MDGFAAVPRDAPNVCIEQLFPLDSDSYQYTFSRKKCVIPGLHLGTRFPNTCHENVKECCSQCTAGNPGIGDIESN